MALGAEPRPVGRATSVTAPTFHPEVLSSEAQSLLRRLGPLVTARSFYMGGGTALAIQLGHRRSIDFDWFTPQDLDQPERLAADLAEPGLNTEVEQTTRGTLHATIDGIQVTFLSYRYPLLRPLVAWEEPGCHLASLEDIACMKLVAVAQRGARKDFVDLFALARTGITLAQMIERFREKYQRRETGHLLAALSYFDDAEREPMPEMIWPTDWHTMKREIRAWVKAYVG